MESYIVGGFGGGQWLHTLTGPAISQITDCIDQARPGQVVISHQCVTMLRRGETVRIQGRDSAGGVNAGMSPNASNSLLDVLDSELHAGAYSLLNTGEFERMHVHDQEGGAVRAAPLVSDTSERNVSVGYVRFEEKIRRYSQTWKEGSAIEPQRSLKSALQSFAPAPVLRAIRSGSASSGELRRLTILFLHLDPPQQDSGLLQKIQHVCGIIQREVQRFEGYLKEVTVDDKGFVAVIGFGVPPHAHDDDPVRGLQCAMAMEALLHNERVDGLAFGITTGEVFCGSIGNKRRAEYGMVGTKVVLAARLMAAVLKGNKERGFVIVDADTYQATKHTMSFETDVEGMIAVETIKVKGREDLIATYRPSKEVSIFRKSSSSAKAVSPVGSIFVTPNRTLRLSARDPSTGTEANTLQRRGTNRRTQTGLWVPGITKTEDRLSTCSRNSSSPRNSATTDLDMWPLHGRDIEVQIMQVALDTFVDKHCFESKLWRGNTDDATLGPAVEPAGTGAVILIEGSSGIGKTSLMKRTVDLAQRTGFCVIDISFEHNGGGRGGGGGFNSWFRILDALIREVEQVLPLGIKSLPSNQKRRIHLMHLQGMTLRTASDFMSIDAEDVDALFDELHTCVAWLVHEAMKIVPVALFVDDAASLGFEGLAMMHTLVAENNLPGLMLVIAVQPSQVRKSGLEEIMSHLRYLASGVKDDAHETAVPRTTFVASTKVVGSAHLPLRGLDEDGTEAAVLRFARAEGGRSVETRLLKFLHERSGGNPWHAKEWLLDRMKYELILVQGPEQRTGTDRDGTSLEKPIMKNNTTVQVGEMHLKEIGALLRAQLPYSVRASVTASLDKLDEDELIALRVSAVLGEVSSNLLDAVELSNAPGRLADSLPRLVKSGHLVPLLPGQANILACFAAGHCEKKFGVALKMSGGEQGVDEEQTVYRFVSQVMQDVAYGSWGLEHRSEVHQSAVDMALKHLRRLDELSGGGYGVAGGANPRQLQVAITAVRVECYATIVHHRCMGEQYEEAVAAERESDASVGSERLLAFCVNQASQIFGAEHLDPEKYSIDLRMEHVHLIPHMRGVMMVREMKTKARFARLRGVMHIGGFKSVNGGAGAMSRGMHKAPPETESEKEAGESAEESAPETTEEAS
mmetsp:Transcript_9782/g.24170  ORF Transcript_9782/g.24170 Transcript_9782/m.24170 type:complete len:1140 (-) Transcript_9782:196-3615(-)